MATDYTTTPNYSFRKPIPGASSGDWGTTLNATIDMLDVTFPAPGVLTPNTLILNSIPGTGVVASLTFGNSTAALGQQSRWALVEDTTSEGGAGAGSNFSIRNYNDSGAPQGTPISITRSNGLVTFNSAGAAGSASFVGLATFATLTATGVATFSGAVTFSGAATFSDLTASGTVTGANVTATGVLHSNSTLTVAGAATLSGGASVSGGLSVANALSVNSGAATFSGGVNGPTSFNSNISVAGNGSFGSLSTGTMSASGNINVANLGLPNGGNISCPSGAVITTDGSGGWEMVNGGSGNFTLQNNNAFKPGGGAWGTLSDERIKTVTGEYEPGLGEVLQLRPVTYVYKSGVDREFVGFVAQDLEQIMPSMVSQQRGLIDGEEVSDLRTVDTTELVFMLVNCVKQLKAEIEELKAR